VEVREVDGGKTLIGFHFTLNDLESYSCFFVPSVGLEFPAGQLAGSGYWREQFQTISEDVSVRNVLMHSAH